MFSVFRFCRYNSKSPLNASIEIKLVEIAGLVISNTNVRVESMPLQVNGMELFERNGLLHQYLSTCLIKRFIKYSYRCALYRILISALNLCKVYSYLSGGYAIGQH